MILGQLFGELRSGMRLLAALALGLVLLLPAVSVVSVLFGGGSEVSYSFSLFASTCRQLSAPCLTYAELELGNTGKRAQEHIEIELSNLPPWSAVDHYSVKIVASNKSLARPVVTIDDEQQRIAIQGLAANQMITFQFVIPGRITRDELRAASPQIESTGTRNRKQPEGDRAGARLQNRIRVSALSA